MGGVEAEEEVVVDNAGTPLGCGLVEEWVGHETWRKRR
jgi:hypothetical protein